jgi:hypothetical protein
MKMKLPPQELKFNKLGYIKIKQIEQSIENVKKAIIEYYFRSINKYFKLDCSTISMFNIEKLSFSTNIVTPK